MKHPLRILSEAERAAEERRRQGRARQSCRVLCYSHDSFGLGHLRRSVSVASALVQRTDQVTALCLTGSPTPSLFTLPERCEVVKVPSITKDDGGEYVARNLPLPFHELAALRSELITAAVRSFRPDVLLVDHTPTGPGNELLPVLRRVRHESRRTKVVLGLRDIIDEPARVRAQFRRDRVYDVLEAYYDRILVYGNRRILDVEKDYGFPENLLARTDYVGLVCPPEVATGREAAPGEGRILVTAGGGQDGYDLLRGAVAALRGPLRDLQMRVVLVAGPLMDRGHVEDLRRAIQADQRLELLRTTSHMSRLQAAADLVIGMGGYNTVYETLAQGKPFLAMPRTAPRLEQLERCRRLENEGLLLTVSAEEVGNPRRMAEAMTAALAFRPDSAVRGSLGFDGAKHSAEKILDVARDEMQRATSALLGNP